MSKYTKIRWQVFFKVLGFFGIEQNQEYPFHIKSIFCLLFPLRAINYLVNKDNGFDMQRNAWKIFDNYFSNEIFYSLSLLENGEQIVIVKVDNKFKVQEKWKL